MSNEMPKDDLVWVEAILTKAGHADKNGDIYDRDIVGRFQVPSSIIFEHDNCYKTMIAPVNIPTGEMKMYPLGNVPPYFFYGQEMIPAEFKKDMIPIMNILQRQGKIQ